MAKQKLVLKVAAMEDAKRRSKALKTAVGLSGVISASLDKDCLIVVGDGVDSVELATVLRRKMGSANLVSVGSAEEKKKEEKKPEEKKPVVVAESNKFTWQPAPASYWIMCPEAPQPYNHCQCASDCSIM
ncbi:heavy metal-associated isoprenylated plant protein 16-like [Zingiber officinale]|uniref:heavy metal-associated isoprenylated plant protein 16-like n=1 Tax=Zingiber officinale TaxID=94328 RepID=UPI001C4C065C|nr:heavy metal-associated isoprenylated plant protein 16-like [Zingiber officinale]